MNQFPEIIKEVADACGLTESSILSDSTCQDIKDARAMAQWMLGKRGWSQYKIGKAFNIMQTTVASNQRRVQRSINITKHIRKITEKQTTSTSK